ncbi:UxaA family hydrolase [Thermococcus sp. SY098]|uniref:UxaA family hydrolase n=1 Tax=Thermococcus sp. SY098 TaxID=3111325 RepID=UPI002D77A7F5|nr:UxaA family hydrolase [Thermococcus sp. SY098]WRS52302.1 UxaA family hydrolase [Thermococcus sp. SY098]
MKLGEIKGWRRENGDFGIRNHIVVLSSVACANHAALEIARRTGAIPIIQEEGACGMFGEDRKRFLRCMANVGSHPNVAWTLVVGLGCEGIDAHQLADEISKRGRNAESLLIQELGMDKTVEKGVELVNRAKENLTPRRETAGVEELVIGLKCGASDYTSGLISNPSVGKAVDILIEHGGTAIITERLELVGAEQILARRAKSKEVAEDFLRRIKKAVEDVNKRGVDWIGSQPSMGNIKGGLTTIEEKSLGAVKKAGNAQLEGCLDYGEKPKGRGLYFMDGPGYDVKAVSGLMCAGSHIILFTTGLGTYLGSPVSPVIKITGNPTTARKLRDAIDVDLSVLLEEIISRDASLDEILEIGGRMILEEIVRVANGKLTKAEKSQHIEFSIELTGIIA